MKEKRLSSALLLLSAFLAALHNTGAQKPIGGGCDGCDLMFAGMPKSLDWQTTMTDISGGEPLEIEGIIFQEDGTTPARDVILYVYHTNAQGFYAPAAAQTVARRHGQLRGWMKTDAAGRYKFLTIRPAPYPRRDIPAHIHPVISEPGKNEYYLDDYLFDDDPLLTKEKRDAQGGRGGSGIVRLTKNAARKWVGRRDIILGRSIPDYR